MPSTEGPSGMPSWIPAVIVIVILAIIAIVILLILLCYFMYKKYNKTHPSKEIGLSKLTLLFFHDWCALIYCMYNVFCRS